MQPPLLFRRKREPITRHFRLYQHKEAIPIKKIILVFLLLLCLLAAGCAPQTEQPIPVLPFEEEETCGPGVPYTITCRIITGAESGNLLLAEHGDAGSGVYTLSTSVLPDGTLPDQPLQDGQLIRVYYGAFAESWPMQFGGVTAIEIVDGGMDDRCALYLRVLEDLWEKDSGLNGGVEVIGVDLSQTSLSPSEQSAVAWAFAGNHEANLAEGSLEDLTEQGYITATPLSSTGSGADLNDPKYYFYAWENGCHFSITEQPMEGTYSLTPVTFEAQKWRSSLGAYFFSNCTAVQSALGKWSDYTIGSEMIS